jgi:nitric oxide reductase NorE protein
MRVPDTLKAEETGSPPDRQRDDKHVPGEPGVWVLLFGDLAVFTVLFAVYLNERGRNAELFGEAQGTLNRNAGAINTVVLLSSSLIVVLAVQAFRHERYRHLTSRLLLAGAAIGALFVVIKVFEYHEKLAAGITPSTNDFFMYYFVLTGLHLAHVLLGLAILVVLSRTTRTATPSSTHVAFLEGGACFWHLVDLLWIVIFPLIFLVR